MSSSTYIKFTIPNSTLLDLNMTVIELQEFFSGAYDITTQLQEDNNTDTIVFHLPHGTENITILKNHMENKEYPYFTNSTLEIIEPLINDRNSSSINSTDDTNANTNTNIPILIKLNCIEGSLDQLPPSAVCTVLKFHAKYKIILTIDNDKDYIFRGQSKEIASLLLGTIISFRNNTIKGIFSLVPDSETNKPLSLPIPSSLLTNTPLLYLQPVCIDNTVFDTLNATSIASVIRVTGFRAKLTVYNDKEFIYSATPEEAFKILGQILMFKSGQIKVLFTIVDPLSLPSINNIQPINTSSTSSSSSITNPSTTINTNINNINDNASTSSSILISSDPKEQIKQKYRNIYVFHDVENCGMSRAIPQRDNNGAIIKENDKTLFYTTPPPGIGDVDANTVYQEVIRAGYGCLVGQTIAASFDNVNNLGPTIHYYLVCNPDKHNRYHPSNKCLRQCSRIGMELQYYDNNSNADNKIKNLMQKVIDLHGNNKESAKQTLFILVSSDRDFSQIVHQARTTGIDVAIIHSRFTPLRQSYVSILRSLDWAPGVWDEIEIKARQIGYNNENRSISRSRSPVTELSTVQTTTTSSNVVTQSSSTSSTEIPNPALCTLKISIPRSRFINLLVLEILENKLALLHPLLQVQIKVNKVEEMANLIVRMRPSATLPSTSESTIKNDTLISESNTINPPNPADILSCLREFVDSIVQDEPFEVQGITSTELRSDRLLLDYARKENVGFTFDDIKPSKPNPSTTNVKSDNTNTSVIGRLDYGEIMLEYPLVKLNTIQSIKEFFADDIRVSIANIHIHP